MLSADLVVISWYLKKTDWIAKMSSWFLSKPSTSRSMMYSVNEQSFWIRSSLSVKVLSLNRSKEALCRNQKRTILGTVIG